MKLTSSWTRFSTKIPKELVGVGRLRERQYQLTAQKRNQDFLRHSLHTLNARYFERECGIARQFNSWIDKEPKGLAEKARQDKLSERREKLRTLLQEEEEIYRKEIEERERSRREKPREELSLEALKEKLKQKQSELRLYLPRTCGKYRNYLIKPKDSIGPLLNRSLDSNGSDSSSLYRDSPDSYLRHQRISSRRAMSSIDTWSDGNHGKSPDNESEMQKNHSKYLMRYSRKSLENTNVSCGDAEKNGNVPPKGTSSPDSANDSDKPTNNNHDETSVQNEIESNGYHHHHNFNHEDDQKTEETQTSRGVVTTGDLAANIDEKNEGETPLPGQAPQKSNKEKKVDHANENIFMDHIPGHGEDHLDGDITRSSGHHFGGSKMSTNLSNEASKKTAKISDHQKFESERSLPWLRMDPHDKNLSEQMFLYLTHKDMKQEIDDLAKRELQACTRQNWTEALRLRDMKNRLELIRERRLYNMENLELEEQIRLTGLENIEKRAQELELRENTCMDSTLYSEEAKVLWKQWVKEDEQSVIKNARQERETLMKSLEKEWQNLAIQEKEKIANSFKSSLNASSLQEEQRLTAALLAAKSKS